MARVRRLSPSVDRIRWMPRRRGDCGVRQRPETVVEASLMSERWSRDQVLALAPDAASRQTAERVATPGLWSDPVSYTGEDVAGVWGSCKGSGARPYRACVDLSGPAYRCTCPSRKFPCKHALALLLLWSEGGVWDAPALAGWVAEWVEQRRERGARAAGRRAARPPGGRAPGGGGGRSGGPAAPRRASGEPRRLRHRGARPLAAGPGAPRPR